MKSHLALFISLPETAQLANAGILTVTRDVGGFYAVFIYWHSIHIKMAFCTSEAKMYKFYTCVVMCGRGKQIFSSVTVNLSQT